MYELRLCATKHCNFECTYCRLGGEGVYNENPIMKVDEIKKCMEFMARKGFHSVRITGGEPTLRKDIVELINEVGNIDGIKNVSMVTNASLITDELVDKLKKSKLNSITVSLDTLDRQEFKEIVKVDCFDKVIDNIIKLRKAGINTRINMVVTSHNVGMLGEVQNFCLEHGTDLKLLDLNNNGMDNWEGEYVNFKAIVDELRKNCISEEVEQVQGNSGTPMNIFKFENYSVIIKDSNNGTCYVENCKNCEHFPCQTGVSSPIITHDGYVKYCNLGDLSDFNLLNYVNTIQCFKEFETQFRGMSFKTEWNKKYREEAVC